MFCAESNGDKLNLVHFGARRLAGQDMSASWVGIYGYQNLKIVGFPEHLEFKFFSFSRDRFSMFLMVEQVSLH